MLRQTLSTHSQNSQYTLSNMSNIRFPYWLLLLLFLAGCRPDVTEFEPYEASTSAMSEALAKKIPSAVAHQSFTFNNLSSDILLEMPNGTRVFFSDTDQLFANASTGSPVLCSTCADLNVAVTEVFDKSDIIARGLSTVAKNGVIFENGGILLITVSCNGQALSILPNRTIKVQMPNVETYPDFLVYERDQAVENDTRWTTSSQAVFEAEWPLPNGGIRNGYEVLVKKLGWIAAGRPFSDATSYFCTTLPTGFGGQNTLAYLVFKNKQAVAPLTFDLGQNRFCHSKAPAGHLVQVVSVSKLGNDYWLGSAQTEIGTNQVFPLDSQMASEEAVFNFLKSL